MFHSIFGAEQSPKKGISVQPADKLQEDHGYLEFISV